MIAIADFLKKGKDNAITGAELCQLTGMNSIEVRTAIMRERRSGQPICAEVGTRPGYFLAETREEMQKFCDSLRHRAGEIFKTRAACLAQLDNLPEETGNNEK